MTGHATRRYRFTKRTLPEPGPRPVHQPRDEPLHHLLPLRALLQGLRGRHRPRRVRRARQRVLRPRTRTACSRTSSPATWSRCARPASSPTRPTAATTPASGTCSSRRRCAPHCARRLQHAGRASATASCGGSTTATTATVNGYFLCDRGRFGYGFVNREDRPRQPLARGAARRARRPSRRSRRSTGFAELLRDAARVVGIGSPRASLEANFALRALVGAAHFSPRHRPTPKPALLERAVAILRDGPAAQRRRCARRRSLRRGAGARRGRDPDRAARRARAAPGRRGKALELATCRATFRAGRTRRIARIGQHRARSVLHRRRRCRRGSTTWRPRTLRARRPLRSRRSASRSRSALDAAAAAERRGSMRADRRSSPTRDRRGAARREAPLIVSGTARGDRARCSTPRPNVARRCRAASAPGIALIARREPTASASTLLGGLALESSVGRGRPGRGQTLIVLENDLYRRAPRARVDAALANVRIWSVIDHQLERDRASARDVVLPAATFAEGDGTLVSYEGRAQRYFQVFDRRDAARCARAGAGCGESAGRAGLRDRGNRGRDHRRVASALALEHWRASRPRQPSAPIRAVAGRQARRASRTAISGRTAMRADRSVHEPRAADGSGFAAGVLDGRLAAAPGAAGALMPFVLGAAAGTRCRR